MENRKGRYEAYEEHVQALIQKDRSDAGGLSCGCHAGRLLTISTNQQFSADGQTYQARNHLAHVLHSLMVPTGGYGAN
jgi:hypothetical protein